MDHLALPYGATLTADDEVLDVSLGDYESVPFLEYPSRYPKYRVAQTRNDAVVFSFTSTELGQPLLDRFLQTWLFFALLHEILGPMFAHADFVRDVGGEGGQRRRVLSTALLNQRLKDWRAKVEADPQHDHSISRHWDRCLTLAEFALTAAVDELSPKLKFLLATVGECLGSAVCLAAERARGIGRWDESFDGPARLRLLTEQQGWCPAQASMFLEWDRGPSVFHFFSHLKITQPRQKHADCTSTTCLAAQIIPSQYVTGHTESACSCEHICIDPQSLNSVLLAGRIPLLKLTLDPPSGAISTTIISSDTDLPYIALSHVWSDGLGNPFENALPSCQLRRLYTLLLQFDSTVSSQFNDTAPPLLWIDTLCCPSKISVGKTVALGRMARTYQNAAGVLVLESSLYDIDDVPLSPMEILARVDISAWMFRLWTTQEAFLAKALFIQFKHRVVNYDECAARYLKEMLQPFTYSFRLSIRGRIEPIREGNQSSRSLLGLANAIRCRSVSVKSDEALCIGAYFGVDVEALAATPTDGQARMRELWRLIGDIEDLPRNMIFQSSERLLYPGFGWAPQTVLGIESPHLFRISSEDTLDDPPASLTPDGLHFSCLAGSITVPSHPSGCSPIYDELILLPNKYMVDNAGCWYKVLGEFSIRPDLPDLDDRTTLAAGQCKLILSEVPRGERTYFLCLLTKYLGRQHEINHVQGHVVFMLTPVESKAFDVLNAVVQESALLHKHPLSKQLEDARALGEINHPAYIEALDQFNDSLQESAAKITDTLGESAILDSMPTLGVQAAAMEVKMRSMLQTFYNGRYFMIGPLKEERFCHH